LGLDFLCEEAEVPQREAAESADALQDVKDGPDELLILEQSLVYLAELEDELETSEESARLDEADLEDVVGGECGDQLGSGLDETVGLYRNLVHQLLGELANSLVGLGREDLVEEFALPDLANLRRLAAAEAGSIFRANFLVEL